ncbi:arginine:agmatin antiporter [Yersinia aldovae ATCC 35236]|nr:arginine:agmatin antiporter [Yersinia aldovae ATCC 35236]
MCGLFMDICRAEYYWAKMITRVQAVATSLALIPIGQD